MQKLQQRGQRLLEFNALRPHGLASGKCQQLAGQLFPRIDGATHGRQRRTLGQGLILSLVNRKVVHHHHQKVVEVVGNAAGQAAQGLQFLTLHQGQFGLSPAFGFLQQTLLGFEFLASALQCKTGHPREPRCRGKDEQGQQSHAFAPGRGDGTSVNRHHRVHRVRAQFAIRGELIHVGHLRFIPAIAIRRLTGHGLEQRVVGEEPHLGSRLVRPAGEQSPVEAGNGHMQSAFGVGEFGVEVCQVLRPQTHMHGSGEAAVTGCAPSAHVEERLAGGAADALVGHKHPRARAAARHEVPLTVGVVQMARRWEQAAIGHGP